MPACYVNVTLSVRNPLNRKDGRRMIILNRAIAKCVAALLVLVVAGVNLIRRGLIG